MTSCKGAMEKVPARMPDPEMILPSKRSIMDALVIKPAKMLARTAGSRKS